MAKIICVGSSSKDIFFPTSEGIIINTPEDITSQKKLAFELGAKFQVKKRYESVGGCAANVAMGLAKLGERVECCTKVGGDDIGQWIKKTFLDGGVNLDSLEEEKECKSDLSLLIVDTNTGERIPFSDRDANERLVIFPKKFNDAGWIFISSLNGCWEKNLEKLLKIANEKNIKIAFNPGQKNIKTGIEFVLQAIKKSDLFFINKDEAIEIIKGFKKTATPKIIENEEYLLKTLYNVGAKVVALTDGTRGAWIYDGKKILHAEALLQKAVDTTGAGDAFTSGFFAAYLKNKDLSECLKWGIANSSSSVKFYGGVEGLLTEERILEYVSRIVVKKLG